VAANVLTLNRIRASLKIFQHNKFLYFLTLEIEDILPIAIEKTMKIIVQGRLHSNAIYFHTGITNFRKVPYLPKSFTTGFTLEIPFICVGWKVTH
jgi:hypothetical protein